MGGKFWRVRYKTAHIFRNFADVLVKSYESFETNNLPPFATNMNKKILPNYFRILGILTRSSNNNLLPFTPSHKVLWFCRNTFFRRLHTFWWEVIAISRKRTSSPFTIDLRCLEFICSLGFQYLVKYLS